MTFNNFFYLHAILKVRICTKRYNCSHVKRALTFGDFKTSFASEIGDNYGSKSNG